MNEIENKVSTIPLSSTWMHTRVHDLHGCVLKPMHSRRSEPWCECTAWTHFRFDVCDIFIQKLYIQNYTLIIETKIGLRKFLLHLAVEYSLLVQSDEGLFWWPWTYQSHSMIKTVQRILHLNSTYNQISPVKRFNRYDSLIYPAALLPRTTCIPRKGKTQRTCRLKYFGAAWLTSFRAIVES